MDLKKTIKNFTKLEGETSKKKYLGDATRLAFFKHVLKLLAKISKTRIEEEQQEQVPQEAGYHLFKCKRCDTDGYIEGWDSDKENNEIKVIEDCHICNGEGFIKLKVVDKRKKSKDNPLYYNNDY